MTIQLDPATLVVPAIGLIFHIGATHHRLASIEKRQRREARWQGWYADNLLRVMERLHIPVSEFPDEDA